ncbi:MAG: hypothetical protein ACI9BW_000667 [Gammaproteobacteria bacterium]|jgi:uncharacterized protein (DUF1501 family)
MSTVQLNRRRLLGGAAAGLGAGICAPWSLSSALANTDANSDNDRILVVLELSGGNDGLNTVVPYADDAYYRQRPTIGIRPEQLIKIDDHFGFNPGVVGFERLWKNGELAIVHGCGYENPSFSHFTSMAYWHTAAPNSGNDYGWVGRLADSMSPEARLNYIINIDTTQSLAVRSAVHNPVVFDEPDRFQRNGLRPALALLNHVGSSSSSNPTQAYLNGVATSAREASSLVRNAWSAYKSPVDYGIAPLQLPKIAACISAGMPTKLYYAAFRNNSFDTHVQQGPLHQRLLTYAADAVHGFIRDLERLGQADRVVVVAFSEFGRRVPENTSLGTDHGAANVMFVAGKNINGGHYGQPPSLTELDEGDNLKYTTDFRRVYASAIDGWLRQRASANVLNGEFETFPIFS